MKIFLVRHGQTDWNVENRLQGCVDIPLNKNGIKQAQTLAENIKELKTKEVFNLSEEVKKINSMFESMAYEKKINLKSNVQENISFNGNKEDIKQVLSVLIENASSIRYK